ncbi:hypothetical protein DFP72DRAFT_1168689 [Ephemerocybe angulata]|uniref:Uncharacterized protein n=1 Tax=Ephemerocybe angulata TaxID=980116 RepID=A0A8H6M9F5_9AGAR|nr:hypothetical protein DFP72DRAFT_1168689 [Tulosesus angulatus]
MPGARLPDQLSVPPCFSTYHLFRSHLQRLDMSQYHRLPAQEPENDQFELDAPTTPSKAPKVATQKRSTDKVVQWITAILLLNVVVLVLNVYLSTGTASRVAMFQEKPLSALPRPDPLYGISRKAPSTVSAAPHV